MADHTPRFPFSASAEVASDDSVEVTRVTELSRHGCYLETAEHRKAGTRVTVKIINKDQIFEATATVLYSRPMIDKAHQADPTDPEIHSLWVGKLSRAEKIKYLQQYLAGETNDDAETRAGMQQYLKYLNAMANDPRGACQLASETTTTETRLLPILADVNSRHLRGYAR